MDYFDWIAFLGFLLLAGAASLYEAPLVGAGFAGFCLSLCCWRLYTGDPWEALAWLAFVGTAVTVVLEPGGAVFLLGFFGPMLFGVAVLFASRLEWLSDVWTVDESGSG